MSYLEAISLLRKQGYQVIPNPQGAKISHGRGSGEYDSYTKAKVIALAMCSVHYKQLLKRTNKTWRRKVKQELALGKEILTDRSMVRGGDPWDWY